MVGLLLENIDTRQQIGFLAGVFEVISRHGVSVDLVATSETTTTLAIQRQANDLDDATLERLVADLEPLCRVEAFPDCSCVNLVGRGARRALPALAAAREFFEHSPLLMASQSANDMSISLLVRAEDAVELAGLLHRELVERVAGGDARLAGGADRSA
jgi:aspartokinase